MSDHEKMPGRTGLRGRMKEPLSPGKLLALVRNRLLAGLAVSVPLAVTVWVLVFAYGFIAQISRPLLHVFGVEKPPPGTAFVLTLLLLFGLGVMATNVLGAKVFGFVDRVVLKMPLVAKIYAGIKQMMESFKGLGGTPAFQRVVWVDYPVEGYRLMGYVTGQFFDSQTGKDKTSVFLPTSPNPMTGFVLVVDSDKVQNAALSLEEATKMIVSCGLVAPVRRR